MPINDRTTRMDLPLPHADNLLEDDVARMREALTSIDAQAALKDEPSVVEYANLAALPAIGVTGVIYITLDNDQALRWGGTAYVAISAPMESTDDLPEGVANLYFTVSRAAAAVPAATVTVRGGVKVGTGLNVAGDGTLSVTGGGGGTGLPAFGELVLVPATNGQTVLTPAGGYAAGQIELYQNGVLLYGNGDDYIASNGTTIILTLGSMTTDSFLLRKWEYLPAAVTVAKTSATGSIIGPAGTSAPCWGLPRSRSPAG